MKQARSTIHHFFESPATPLARSFQGLIISMILLSAGLVIAEWVWPTTLAPYQGLIQVVEYIILGVFTIEYVLRLSTAPNWQRFVINPYNVIDLLAIAPFYLGINNTALLRLFRLLRLLKLLKYLRLGRVVRWQGTILQKIAPLLIFLIAVKSIFWLLEYKALWAHGQNLGELFAIIGFALGIILSQKIGSTYGKYLEVETTLLRIQSSLDSVVTILAKQDIDARLAVKRWLGKFLQTLQSEQSHQFVLQQANAELYKVIAHGENGPAELAILHKDICADATFCLGKAKLNTPRAYDVLLQQATLFYLVLVAIFIPGIGGIISVLAATYMLYGMYYVTQDLDTLVGGEFDLISVDMSHLQQYHAAL